MSTAASTDIIRAIGEFLKAVCSDTAFLLVLLVFSSAVISLIIWIGLRLFTDLFQPNAGKFFGFYRAFTFLGILSHELSHALFAVLTGATVKRIRIGKSRGVTCIQTRGNKLRQMMQLSVSSAAPILGGLIWTYLIVRFLFPLNDNIFYRSFLTYLILSILLHADMSGQDILVWLKGFPGFLLFLFLFCLVIRLFALYGRMI